MNKGAIFKDSVLFQKELQSKCKVSKLLGLDLSASRIGVAISDSHGQIAIPLGILKKTVGTKGYFHQNPANLLKTIAGESISGWIIGWPLPLNKMDKHYRLGETMKIIESLPGVFGHPPPPILLHDERFTTVMARIKAFEEGIIAKTEVDHFAASFILQEYLDFSSRAIFKYDAGEDG